MTTNYNGQIVNMTDVNQAGPAAPPFDPALLLSQLPDEALIQIPETVPATSDVEDDQTMESDMEETTLGPDVIQDFLDFFETGEIA